MNTRLDELRKEVDRILGPETKENLAEETLEALRACRADIETSGLDEVNARLLRVVLRVAEALPGIEEAT